MGSIEDGASEWLAKHGYPLEMRVARSCRRAGAHVTQAHYYRDPDTEKFRELDLVSVFHGRDIETHYSVILVIECESAIVGGGEKPWMVFSTDFEYGPSVFTHSYLPLSEAAREFSVKHVMGVVDGSVDVPPMLPLMRGPDRVGYGLVRMREWRDNQPDHSYGTVIALVKAAEAQAQLADKSMGFGSCTIVIPVLVVDGELLECSLPEDADSPTITRVDSSVMFVTNPAGREVPTFVYVVRATAFDAFLTDVVALTLDLTPKMQRLVPTDRLIELRQAKSKKRGVATGDDSLPQED
jgi:hypothetical protein